MLYMLKRGAAIEAAIASYSEKQVLFNVGKNLISMIFERRMN